MVKLEQDVIRFETEQASLKETLVSALSSVYEKAEKKEIRIVTEPFPDCLLEHNPKWTAEVFVNILENAVKYSESGSQIEIQVRPLELFTEIRFRDHGIGIRKEEQNRIFPALLPEPGCGEPGRVRDRPVSVPNDPGQGKRLHDGRVGIRKGELYFRILTKLSELSGDFVSTMKDSPAILSIRNEARRQPDTGCAAGGSPQIRRAFSETLCIQSQRWVQGSLRECSTKNGVKKWMYCR